MDSAGKKLFSFILPVLIMVLILVAGGFFLFPLGTAGLLLWILLAVLGQLWFISFQVKGFPYKCTSCGNVFFRSLFKEMISRKSKHFKCPYCKKELK